MELKTADVRLEADLCSFVRNMVYTISTKFFLQFIILEDGFEYALAASLFAYFEKYTLISGFTVVNSKFQCRKT